MTKIKLCGLCRPQDVAFVNEARPDWCGFVLNVPQSHRSLTPDQARRLREGLAPSILPVGVFVDQPPETVAALLLDGTIAAAQLHGQEDETYLAALRQLAPKSPLWRAFQIRSPEDRAAAEASSADLILLDSGQGSGRPFDWSLIQGITRPFLLAGGLTPDTIPLAVRTVRPYGLDLSSGVETDRRKDRAKMLAAVAAARA